MNKTCYVTGNEYVSLPIIREEDGGIEDITFLTMALKGQLDVRGCNEMPLLKPFLKTSSGQILLRNLSWNTINSWIPEFHFQGNDFLLEGTILSPREQRGFAYRLFLRNTSEKVQKLDFGFEGCWDSTFQSINEDKKIESSKYIYNSNWNHGIVMDLRMGGAATFALAPMFSDEKVLVFYQEAEEQIRYQFEKKTILKPQEETDLILYFGIGYEEVAAATQAKDMLRHGYGKLYMELSDWLLTSKVPMSDPVISELFHRNLFFNYFYASGRTLDTEELVLVTSRSPRYYVSAAYWDRDSFLWSFPAMLLMDTARACEMLDYAFGRQGRNIGIHSRYIDGTVLEPGFELDELCAPILAMVRYIQKTNHKEYVSRDYVRTTVESVLQRLKQKKHPKLHLYETFLQPTDDVIVYPYLTYNNVLVASMLESLADLYHGIWTEEYCKELKQEAVHIKTDIRKHCCKEYRGKEIYVWSVDGNGKFDVYDEPPGSLRLLPLYGFCEFTEDIYINTVECIKDPSYPYSFHGCPIAEIGCAHAPHPWVLSIANALLTEAKDSTELLYRMKMDSGIACESVDEVTGESTTGDAFATCAGFLAYALHTRYAL